MKFDLSQKGALITGAASGIGRAIALTFAAQGATVHLFDLNKEKLNTLAQTIQEQGGKATQHLCDIQDGKTFQSLVKDLSPLNILINNAGIAHVGNLENTDEATLDKLYGVNIKGVFNGTKAVLPHFKKQKGGCILNVASIAGSVAVADRFAYSMTKGAVLAMTYSTAKDYVAYGIRCNSISPARIHTPFVDGFLAQNYPGKENEMFEKLSKTQPIGRMGTPQEVADLALYLCSDEAGFITGTDVPIDGGFIKLNG
jgi:2-keto-3-deoxy-L-fuconate dehydrogenase